MKFGLFLKQNMVAEWEEFYIQFEVLKQLLAPLEENYKKESIITLFNISIKKKKLQQKKKIEMDNQNRY